MPDDIPIHHVTFCTLNMAIKLIILFILYIIVFTNVTVNLLFVTFCVRAADVLGKLSLATAALRFLKVHQSVVALKNIFSSLRVIFTLNVQPRDMSPEHQCFTETMSPAMWSLCLKKWITYV